MERENLDTFPGLIADTESRQQQLRELHASIKAKGRSAGNRPIPRQMPAWWSGASEHAASTFGVNGAFGRTTISSVLLLELVDPLPQIFCRHAVNEKLLVPGRRAGDQFQLRLADA